MNCWNSVSRVDCWIAWCWAFAVSPWNISEKDVLSSLFDGEWTTRITHARSDTIGISTLLASSDSWSTPDTFTLRVGDTLNIGPLESWSNCTWVSSNMLKRSLNIIRSLEKISYLRVTISRSGTSAGIFTGIWCTDKTNRLDVVVVAETAADCQNHIIVINCSGVVTWVSSLRSATFGLSLATSGGRTSSSCPVVGALLAVSCAHNLKVDVRQSDSEIERLS